MEYESATINPQVIFFYDENKNVKKTIFLSRDSVIPNSFAQGAYNFLVSTNTTFLSQPEYINDHVILTFNLEQARSYIKRILKLPEDIILFSIWYNLDYYYQNNDIFDPYDIKSNYEMTDERRILYNININIVDGAIFCVTTNSNSKSQLARYSEYLPIYKDYIYEITKNIYKNNYKLFPVVKESQEYLITTKYQDMVKLSNIEKFKKTLCIGSNNKFYVKGNDITIIDPSMDEYISLNIYKNNTEIIQINNDVLILNKLSSFIDILKEYEIKNINIKSMNPKKVIYIYFDSILNPNLTIQFDLNFFLNETNTRNIFIDLSGKINIMTSKTHISFRSFNINVDLCKYLTLLILGYNHIFNKIQHHGRIKKIDELYPSRYCQNYKDVKRQPILIDSIDEKFLIKVSDKYYVGKEDRTRTYQRKGTKNVFDPFKYGDVYIDDNGLIYQCASVYYSNMGFLNNIYLASGTCYPCCYSKQKNRDSVFEACVYNKDFTIEDKINPIIVNYGRLILTKSGISNLSPKLNSILNSSAEIDIVKHTNRVIYAKNYTVITSYYPSVTIKGFSDLYSFIINNNAIVINDNIVYTHKDILKSKSSTVKLFIIIQNRIHQLKNINKEAKIDEINMTELEEEKIKILKREFNLISSIRKPISHNNITIKDDVCTIDGKIVKQKNIKYFIEYDNISLKPKSTSEYIEKYFKQYLDNIIYTDNKTLFNKIFVTKIMNSLNESDIIKSDFTNINKKLDSITYKQITHTNESNG